MRPTGASRQLNRLADWFPHPHTVWQHARSYLTLEGWIWSAAYATLILGAAALVMVTIWLEPGIVPFWLFLAVLTGAIIAASGMAVRAPAASPVSTAELSVLRDGTLWHATSRQLAVGETVQFDPALCRRRSRMFRRDHPFTSPCEQSGSSGSTPRRHTSAQISTDDEQRAATPAWDGNHGSLTSRGLHSRFELRHWGSLCARRGR